MEKKTTDSVLASMDEILASLPAVACWRCEKHPGDPSLCTECHLEMKGAYASPPKGTKRVIWAEDQNVVLPQ